jgi:hypothetical membrane protein
VSAAVLWVVAALAYFLLEATAATFVPGYSYARHYISILGVAAWSPWAVLMNTAFYLQGILFLAGAVLMARAAGRKALLFLGFAAANAVGNILVGTVHSVPAAGGWPGWHFAGAALAIVGGNAAILAGSSVVRRAGGSRSYRVVSVGLAAVGFLSLVVGWVGSKTGLAMGAWERGSVYPILLWQLFTGGYLLAGRVVRRR